MEVNVSNRGNRLSHLKRQDKDIPRVRDVEALWNLDANIKVAFVGETEHKRHTSIHKDEPVQGFVANTAFVSKEVSIGPRVTVVGTANIEANIHITGECIIDENHIYAAYSWHAQGDGSA